MLRQLSSDERSALAKVSQATSSAPTSLPEEYLALAWDLAKVHGSVRWAKEANGIHLYMASPECLEQHGTVELHKMHLAVNIEKHFTLKRGKVAMCMKTGKAYTLKALLGMPPLEQRGITRHKVTVQERLVDEQFLEDDGKGNKVPKGPGEVIPAHELPADHPASLYLKGRQFDAKALHDQFRLSYGLKERPDMHNFHRRMIKGFKATPQGRLVFHIDVNGVPRGWQARILEMEANGDDGERYLFYFHPYQLEWIAVKKWSPAYERWVCQPGYEDWDAVKYVISRGAQRNLLVMGFDAAVQSGRADRFGRRFCYLLEGPLDAGRFGIPALAHMGKYLGLGQADLIASKFDRVIYVRDNDASGAAACGYVTAAFEDHPQVTLEFAELPAEFKDAGAMTNEQAAEFCHQIT